METGSGPLIKKLRTLASDNVGYVVVGAEIAVREERLFVSKLKQVAMEFPHLLHTSRAKCFNYQYCVAET